METASLSAASPAPLPRTAAPAAAPDSDGGFAALLDQQAPAPTEKGAGKTATRPGKTASSSADKDPPAPAATAGVTDAANAAPSTEASAEETDKGDRGERQIGDGAGKEVADKIAGDAALTDPSAVLTGMLLDLTAPASRPDAAATPAAAEPPAPPALPATAAATAAAEKAAGRSAGSRLSAAPPAAGDGKPAGTAPPAATADAKTTETTPQTTADPSSISAAAPAAPPPPASVATAPAPVAAPRSVPVPLDPEALAVAITRKVDDGHHVFEISLTPDDLGRIDVRLEFAEDGQMTARVYADRPETLHLLQQDKAELVRNLSSQGATLQNTTVSFALRDGHAGQSGGNGAGDGNNGGNGRRGRNQGGSAPEAVASAASPRQRRGGNALAVDIQV